MNYEYTMKAMIHNRVCDPQNDIKPTKKLPLRIYFKTPINQ